MERKVLTYETVVQRLDDGLKHHYVDVPDTFAESMRQAKLRRVVAEIRNERVRRAINRRKDGRAFLVLGQPLLRSLGLELGDTIEVSIRIDDEPDRVDMVEEFQAVLDTDEEAAEIFYAMTPGRQRSLELYVSTAKSSDTRIKRALELAYKIRTRTLTSDRTAKK
jgi:hypothetical protein